MPLTIFKTAEIIETMQGFLEERRPPEHIREELDFDYKIENQSAILFEVRPDWKDNSIKRENPVAKTTWVKSKQIWKIYWMRGDLKWHTYQPAPEVKTIQEFIKIVDEDAYHCFWG